MSPIERLPVPAIEMDLDLRLRGANDAARELLRDFAGADLSSHPVLGPPLRRRETRAEGLVFPSAPGRVFDLAVSRRVDGATAVLVETTTLSRLLEELASEALEGARTEEGLRASVLQLEVTAAIRGIGANPQDPGGAVEGVLEILRNRWGLAGAVFRAHSDFLRGGGVFSAGGFRIPEDLPENPTTEIARGPLLLIPMTDEDAIFGTILFAAESERSRIRLAPFLREVAGEIHAALRTARLARELRAHGVAVEYLNRELANAVEELRQAHAVKDRFLATASHELRTPLTVVRSHIETILSVGAEMAEEDRTRFLRVIMTESIRLTRLIDDLLDLSRLRSMREPLLLAEADLADLVRRTVAPLAPLAAAKRLDLVVRLPSRPVLVRCDADRMVRVVTNLVANAIQYTAVGRVEVALDADGDEGVGWNLAVRDTGPGIPSEILPDLFVPFSTTTVGRGAVEGSGTGLGLAIVRGIVEAHGGSIDVESEVGRGSVFRLRLPAGGERAVRRGERKELRG